MTEEEHLCHRNPCKLGACLNTTHPDFKSKEDLIKATDRQNLEKKYLKISDLIKTSAYNAEEDLFKGLEDDKMICVCPKGFSGKHCEFCEFHFNFYYQTIVINSISVI